MKDQRLSALAKNLVNYSCNLQAGEKVLIDIYGNEPAFIQEIITECYKVGAVPFVNIKDKEIERSLLLGCTKKQVEAMAKYDTLRMSEMDAYIGIRAAYNTSEHSDVPPEKLQLFSKYYGKPIHMDIRVPKTKWVVLRYPTSAMAQSSNMSTEAFEDFYFNVCNLDYSAMSVAMDNLVKLMERTKKVQIVGENTNLVFSIENMPAIKCDGKMNIPDGEVYTAPIKTSVNGYITYNTPSEYNGFTFENIRFEFNNGKIVNALANNTERINELLDTDDGARYIGEFAIGVNPHILNPMKETLFDEKIAGSIHFTPGNSYEDCDNGNKSAVHWDLVYIQRPEYGGGEIYFDDVLVRKDGKFVKEELLCLNPENLI